MQIKRRRRGGTCSISRFNRSLKFNLKQTFPTRLPNLHHRFHDHIPRVLNHVHDLGHSFYDTTVGETLSLSNRFPPPATSTSVRASVSATLVSASHIRNPSTCLSSPPINSPRFTFPEFSLAREMTRSR